MGDSDKRLQWYGYRVAHQSQTLPALIEVADDDADALPKSDYNLKHVLHYFPVPQLDGLRRCCHEVQCHRPDGFAKLGHGEVSPC